MTVTAAFRRVRGGDGGGGGRLNLDKCRSSESNHRFGLVNPTAASWLSYWTSGVIACLFWVTGSASSSPRGVAWGGVGSRSGTL